MRTGADVITESAQLLDARPDSRAAQAEAEIILLDNMTPAQLNEAVRFVAGRARTEASGGVNLESVRTIAETGVDYISVGALTHSARAMDIGLDFEPDH